MYIKYAYLIYSHQRVTLFDKKTKDIYIFNIYFQCCNIIKTGVHICIYICIHINIYIQITGIYIQLHKHWQRVPEPHQ